MSSGSPIRSRFARVAAFELPPGRYARGVARLRQPAALARIGLCLAAAIAMWFVTAAWAPPFHFRSGHIPGRAIVAQAEFQVPDEEKTEAKRRQQRAETICVYQHDVRPLVEMRQALRERMFEVTRAKAFDELPAKFWESFQPDENQTPTSQELYDLVREALADDMELARFQIGLEKAFADYEKNGLLENLEHAMEDGSQTAIFIHPVGNASFTRRLEREQVRIAAVTTGLNANLNSEFQQAGFGETAAQSLALAASLWSTKKGLPTTLTINSIESNAARKSAEASVEPATIDYQVGDRLADGGSPLSMQDVHLLSIEHEAILASTTLSQMIRQSLAAFGMYVAMFVLCGAYLYYHAPNVLADLRQFSTLLLFVVCTVAACAFTAADQWRAEIIPLTLLGMTIAIAHERELALLISTATALAVALSLGHGLAEFVILVSSVSVAILLIGRIRSRTKLIYVGFTAGLVTMASTVGVGTMVGQAFGLSNMSSFTLPAIIGDWPNASFVVALIAGAGWFGFCTLLSGILMTGLLPFVEKLFDVQTDLSLLELGDASHPLLQELAQRAPGTYNHSINVASLAEAAAESIGADSLLVRVGAYFHDIGKMLKPTYFVENQGQEGNRHDTLAPAMSTLVIIAHVKDGADLARQHHLPQPFIDFIEQHHGTTLVEYFYQQATRQSEKEGGEEIDETAFRYPGPKPQTREAGVLMLADASESASRTLVDPAPARIEGLVRELAKKRLADGQFDECGLTLQELDQIEDSLVKSLIAVYHGRVKYPDQQTA